jgi:hypothetical protein
VIGWSGSFVPAPSELPISPDPQFTEGLVTRLTQPSHTVHLIYEGNSKHPVKYRELNTRDIKCGIWDAWEKSHVIGECPCCNCYRRIS